MRWAGSHCEDACNDDVYEKKGSHKKSPSLAPSHLGTKHVNLALSIGLKFGVESEITIGGKFWTGRIPNFFADEVEVV